ncbi:MAG: hypothetical protein ACXWT3_01970 [Methylococcaceae bacterium]
MVKTFSLPICLLALGISLGFAAKPVRAETENVQQNYRYIKPIAIENTIGNVSQDTAENPALADKKPPVESIAKLTDGKGALPAFAQADINGLLRNKR